MEKKVLMDFYESLGRLFPRKTTSELSKLLREAGSTITAEVFLGFLLVSTIFLSLVVTAALMLNSHTKYQILLHIPLKDPTQLMIVGACITFVILTAAIFVILYYSMKSILMLLAENRTHKVEEVLADFLTLMSANVRSGMPLDQAMWHAARPEFGILSDEVRWCIKQAFSGEPLDEALEELSSRFNSKIFKRTIVLIKQAEHTGGEVASVLDMTAQEARRQLVTKREISASLVTYEIFIFFSAVLGAPFLFGVVCKLIGVLQNSFNYLPQTQNMMFGFLHPGKMIITASDFYFFSIVVVIITSFFSASIISVIRHSKKTQTIKYFPLMCGAALIVFFLTTMFLNSVMGYIL